MTRRGVLAAMCAAFLLGALPALAQLASFSKSRLEIGTAEGRRHSFTVEVATTDEQLAQGLMFRKSMPADAGMLFDFRAERPVSMWMKNTLIPLDMVFIAADGRIAGVAERTVPMSTTVISSPGAVRAVLELNGGTASRLGIHAGDRVHHPLFGG
ncbi:MAG: DUF192 domain-containing protein [Solirubrobacterales bacterium]